MALATYRDLASNSRYLRGVAFDTANSEIRAADREEAAYLAKVEIDAALGVTFSTTDTPPLIRLIADLLGSAVIYEWLALRANFGADGEGARKPAYLRKQARQMLDDLRAHKIGIQNTDGSWNAYYPQQGILPMVGVGEAKALTIDPGLAWGQMSQPVASDAELRMLDTERSRRAFDIEASFAGAYGV